MGICLERRMNLGMRPGMGAYCRCRLCSYRDIRWDMRFGRPIRCLCMCSYHLAFQFLCSYGYHRTSDLQDMCSRLMVLKHHRNLAVCKPIRNRCTCSRLKALRHRRNLAVCKPIRSRCMCSRLKVLRHHRNLAVCKPIRSRCTCSHLRAFGHRRNPGNRRPIVCLHMCSFRQVLFYGRTG